MKSTIRKGNNKMRKLLILGSVSSLLFASVLPVLAAGYESPPGWSGRGSTGEPPGWSQVNPGAGGSDGPAQGPQGSTESELESLRSWSDSPRPPGWSQVNPGAGGSDGPAQGPQSSK